MRIGQGIDFHVYQLGRQMILGGIDLELDYGLLGHSDADVLLHALSDAILGALGLGDIGRHFPDSDPAYRGADSGELLKQVLERMHEQGYRLVNADLTLIGQKPKLAPYRDRIEDNIKRLTGCEAINVKATTTEKMGAIGREEGLAAMAIVLLEHATLPEIYQC